MRECTSCEFAELTVGDDGPRIDCRRYPPGYVTFDGEPARVWPQVSADDWCGEYQASPAIRVRGDLPEPGAPSIDLLDP